MSWTLDQAASLLEGAGQTVYYRSSMDLAIHCPFCPTGDPDQTGKCYITPEKMGGIFHCFRCESAGTLRSLFRHLGIQVAGVTVNTGLLQERILKAERARQFREASLPAKLGTHDLPDEFKQLEPSDVKSSWMAKKAYGFLERRGVTWSQILEWRIGYCSTGKYAQSIIFPVFDAEGKQQSFQTRQVVGMSEMKSKNPYSEEGTVGKEEVLYGVHRVGNRNVLVLVEGPFDVLHLQRVFAKAKLRDHKPIGLFGHKLSSIQLMMLSNLNAQSIYIMLDSDVPKDAWKMARNLAPRVGAKVYLTLLEEGDPDDLSPRGALKKMMESCQIVPMVRSEKEPWQGRVKAE